MSKCLQCDQYRETYNGVCDDCRDANGSRAFAALKAQQAIHGTAREHIISSPTSTTGEGEPQLASQRSDGIEYSAGYKARAAEKLHALNERFAGNGWKPSDAKAVEWVASEIARELGGDALGWMSAATIAVEKAKAVYAAGGEDGARGGWQTIDSAPKDGAAILAWGRPNPRCREGAYQTIWQPFGEGSPARGAFKRGDGPEGGFWYEESNWTQTWQPTHWMPLPEAPR